jgi:hypothetical protein
MIRAVLRLFPGLLLVFGLAGGAQAAPGHLGAPGHFADGAVIHVADSPIGDMDEIFHMEAPRLLFLGAGIVVGALVISPGLGLNELLGVVLGVIGSEFVYQTTYKSSRWF